MYIRSRHTKGGSKAKKVKICLVCSAGGHLVEMARLKNCYSRYPHFFLTFKRIDTAGLTKTEKVFFVDDPARNPINFLRCLFQSARVILKERPEVVISTGGGIAVPPAYIAKLFLGSKIIYIESFCRIEEPSLSGKFVYPISDLFLVQWPGLIKRYGENAKYWGAVI